MYPMPFHRSPVACKAFLAAESVSRTCKAVYFPVAVNVYKVVGYSFKSVTVINRGGLKVFVAVVIKEHNGLFGALAQLVYLAADILVLQGIPVVDYAVDIFGQYKVENIFFSVLVYR